VPLSVVGGAGSLSNTMSPGLRPTSVPSGILIHSAVSPPYTNVTDRTGQWFDSILQNFTNRRPKAKNWVGQKKRSSHEVRGSVDYTDILYTSCKMILQLPGGTKSHLVPPSDKSSTVAEIGDHGHSRHGPKRKGAAVPLSRRAGTSSNTMWPGLRSTSVPTGVFIHPVVGPQ